MRKYKEKTKEQKGGKKKQTKQQQIAGLQGLIQIKDNLKDKF